MSERFFTIDCNIPVCFLSLKLSEVVSAILAGWVDELLHVLVCNQIIRHLRHYI